MVTLMVRAFIAVDLPEDFREKIADIESELKDVGLKFVDPSQVHITLKFLGEVAEEKIKRVGEALEQINCKAFEAKIKGVGVFPKPSYVRVIWLGAEGEFGGLYNEVERVLTPFNFKQDHDFTAHATLARVKYVENKGVLAEKIKKLSQIELGTMKVETIRLKKSTLTPRGPIYETLKEIRLKE